MAPHAHGLAVDDEKVSLEVEVQNLKRRLFVAHEAHDALKSALDSQMRINLELMSELKKMVEKFDDLVKKNFN